MPELAPPKFIPSGSRFITNLPNYRIDTFLADNSTKLVVTFEPMGRIKSDGPNREGWGLAFLQEQGYSVMAVMFKECDWYRKPDLAAFFAQMYKRGFFHGFDEVATYGGSMGGYGALAYAGAVKASTVLALNPQVTLSPLWAPWETRFAFARKFDWQGEFAHAGSGIKNTRNVYVVYDPLTPLDAKQVHLLDQYHAGVVKLKIPVVGHHIPAWMAEMAVLKPTVLAILEGRFCASDFYHSVRKRRQLKRYWQMLISKPRVAKSRLFSLIVLRYAEHYGFPYEND